MNRGFAICPQPLSRLAATAPRPGSLLAFCNHHPKAVPVYGGFEPSAPGGRCSEGRIGRNREYCKRQRSKTTIFQPAFVAANVMSSRKGNGLEMLTAASYSPPQLRLRSAAPPHAVEPFGALYKLIHKQQRGRIASPYLHNLLCSPAARRISHCASNISLRISAISPVRKNGFHRGRKPAYLTLLAWTTKREPSSSSVQVVRVSTWSAWPMDMASDTLELGAVRA